MDKKSKILFVVFGVLIIVSIGLTYWRIIIKKDYIIEAQIDCDPYTERCFVIKCDSENSKNYRNCYNNQDIWYFKIIRRNASRIPLCDINDNNCRAFICEKNEPECEYIFCSEETKNNKEICSDSIEFLKNNLNNKEEK